MQQFLQKNCSGGESSHIQHLNVNRTIPQTGLEEGAHLLVAPCLSFSRGGSSSEPFVPPHQLPYTSAGSSSLTVIKQIKETRDPNYSI